MQELVTVEQVHRVITVLAWALPLVGLLAGVIVGGVHGAVARRAWQGLAVGLLGPIMYAMWLLYSYMVRYDPETGRAGLHSVATLLFNAAIFVVVGAMLGAFYRRLVFPPSDHRDREVEAKEASD